MEELIKEVALLSEQVITMPNDFDKLVEDYMFNCGFSYTHAMEAAHNALNEDTNE